MVARRVRWGGIVGEGEGVGRGERGGEERGGGGRAGMGERTGKVDTGSPSPERRSGSAASAAAAATETAAATMATAAANTPAVVSRERRAHLAPPLHPLLHSCLLLSSYHPSVPPEPTAKSAFTEGVGQRQAPRPSNQPHACRKGGRCHTQGGGRGQALAQERKGEGGGTEPMATRHGRGSGEAHGPGGGGKGWGRMGRAGGEGGLLALGHHAGGTDVPATTCISAFLILRKRGVPII